MRASASCFWFNLNWLSRARRCTANLLAMYVLIYGTLYPLLRILDTHGRETPRLILLTPRGQISGFWQKCDFCFPFVPHGAMYFLGNIFNNHQGKVPKTALNAFFGNGALKLGFNSKIKGLLARRAVVEAPFFGSAPEERSRKIGQIGKRTLT